MEAVIKTILSINGGSSSLKFALYDIDSLKLHFDGRIERMGTDRATLSYSRNGARNEIIAIPEQNTEDTIDYLLHWLKNQIVNSSIIGIGYRIVHGMEHAEAEPITDELLKELTANIDFDPDHLPGEIGIIKKFRNAYPNVLQIACFDTAFHADMPEVAKRLAIPRRYQLMGIRRYGFHGLSYAYLLEELERLAGIKASKGKIIMAHLGSGASLAAVKYGTSMDTSMGFTPASGLPMSTRSGDLDPGIAAYLMRAEKFTSRAFNEFINHQSGLLGLSGTSGDMKDLLKAEATDIRAAEAVEYFCYQTRKWIGGYAAVLGGLDTLMFSGGIGEHAHEIRSRICIDLGFLGIKLDEMKNRDNESIISSEGSSVTVYVIKTNEELMIARQVLQTLNQLK